MKYYIDKMVKAVLLADSKVFLNQPIAKYQHLFIINWHPTSNLNVMKSFQITMPKMPC